MILWVHSSKKNPLFLFNINLENFLFLPAKYYNHFRFQYTQIQRIKNKEIIFPKQIYF